MKLRGRVLVFLAALCGSALAQPAPASCPPQAFSITAGPRTGRFDVAELRRDRPELYAIIRSRFFQRSGLGAELAKLMQPLDLLGPVRDTPPAFDKLADALPIGVVRNPEPPELASSIQAAMEAARLRIIAECQAAGVARCEALRFLPPPRQR